MADETIAVENSLSKMIPVMTEPITGRIPASALMGGGTGTGSGASSLTVETPEGSPNIRLVSVTPVMTILVRVAKTYLETILGLLTVKLVAPTALPAADFLHLLGLCAGLAIAPGVLSLLRNIIELLAKWDQSHPTLAS